MFSKKTVVFVVCLLLVPTLLWAVRTDTPRGLVDLFTLTDTDGHTLQINADGSVPITGDFLPLDGSDTMTGDLNLGGNKLFGVGSTQCQDDEYIDGLGECTTAEVIAQESDSYIVTHPADDSFEDDKGNLIYDYPNGQIDDGVLNDSDISHLLITDVSDSSHHVRPTAGTLVSEDENSAFNVQESSIHHGNILGLSDDDHPQYLQSLSFQDDSVSVGQAETINGDTNITVSVSGGVATVGSTASSGGVYSDTDIIDANLFDAIDTGVRFPDGTVQNTAGVTNDRYLPQDDADSDVNMNSYKIYNLGQIQGASSISGEEVFTGTFGANSALGYSEILVYDDLDFHSNPSVEDPANIKNVGNVDADTITFSDGTTQTTASSGSVSSDTDFSFSTSHTSWANGLTNEEIFRTQMEAGQSLTVQRIEFRGKGGTSDTASVDVYDASAATVIGTADRGQTTITPGSTTDGATVLLRLSNNTGSSIVGSVYVQGVIE